MVYTCPVEGCAFWISLTGYTEVAIKAMKNHVWNAHPEIDRMDARPTGGIVDRELTLAIRRHQIATCGMCSGTGSIDSGGFEPWGTPIQIPCPACNPDLYRRLYPEAKSGEA